MRVFDKFSCLGRLVLAGVSLSLFSLALADGHGHSHARGHSHAHGQATAEVGLQDRVLKVEIRGAMDNFLSFEHAPKTDAQRAQLKALQDQLKDAAWLVVPAAQAQCKVTSVKAESALFDLSKPVKGHADLDVDIAFECANPSALTSLRFSSLDKGRRMKKLMVAYVGPSGQKAVTLTQAKPVLELK